MAYFAFHFAKADSWSCGHRHLSLRMARKCQIKKAKQDMAARKPDWKWAGIINILRVDRDGRVTRLNPEDRQTLCRIMLEEER